MKALTLKLPEEDLERLTAQAAAMHQAPSAYARKLLAAALRDELVPAGSVAPPGTATPSDSSEDLRRAVWAIIVALSPTLDEATAAQFVADYFDGAASVGYRPLAGGKL